MPEAGASIRTRASPFLSTCPKPHEDSISLSLITKARTQMKTFDMAPSIRQQSENAIFHQDGQQNVLRNRPASMRQLGQDQSKSEAKRSENPSDTRKSSSLDTKTDSPQSSQRGWWVCSNCRATINTTLAPGRCYQCGHSRCSKCYQY